MSKQENNEDELYEVKYAFYLGNFQSCINEAQKLKSSNPASLIERDWFTYRSYLAQRKYGVVNEEIRSSSNPVLQPLKMLSNYLGSASSRDAVVSQLEKQIAGSFDPDNYGFIIVAATIFTIEQNYETALKLLHSSDDLECHALSLQIYLKMDRLDLARKEYKRMQEIDDDSILTHLCQAWLNIETGGEKLQDSFYAFQELLDKGVSSPLILNGQAAVFVCQGKLPEAESALQEAQDKDSSHADTLLNFSVLSQLTGKSSEVSQRYLNLLRDSHPDHPHLRDMQTKERDFDRLCKMYAPSVNA